MQLLLMKNMVSEALNEGNDAWSSVLSRDMDMGTLFFAKQSQLNLVLQCLCLLDTCHYASISALKFGDKTKLFEMGDGLRGGDWRTSVAEFMPQTTACGQCLWFELPQLSMPFMSARESRHESSSIKPLTLSITAMIVVVFTQQVLCLS